MSREWKPGDVIAFTIGGQEYKGIVDTDGKPYTTDQRARGKLATPSSIRPLVVIDPEDRDQVERLTKVLVEAAHAHGNVVVSGNGIHPDTTTAALREFADPKPAIEEPTGLGAVVLDKSGHLWLRCFGTKGYYVWRQNTGFDSGRVRWVDLDVAEVKSPGWSE